MIRIEHVPAGQRLYVEVREAEQPHDLRRAWTIGEDQPPVEIHDIPAGCVMTMSVIDVDSLPATLAQEFAGLPAIDVEPVLVETDVRDEYTGEPLLQVTRAVSAEVAREMAGTEPEPGVDPEAA